MHIRQVILGFCILVSIILVACANSAPTPEPPSMSNTPSQVQVPSGKSPPQISPPSANVPGQETSQSVGTANQIALQIVSVTSPVLADSNATIVIQTVPNAECGITVNYKSGPSKASGLYTKIADSRGKVSWTWKVGSKTTPGTWQIIIQATSHGKNATQTTYFTVR